MNLLTDKAKIDFEKWALEIYGFEYTKAWIHMPKSVFKTLIIEFFDSTEIYILIGRNSLIKKFYYNIDKLHYGGDAFPTRKEATDRALEKANEIYNQK